MIDWFTICAQALNFLILVWLMKRFMYKPILHALDAREKQIAASLAGAEARKADADKQSDEFTHKSEDFDHQRAALLTKATDDARTERDRIMADARQAAETLGRQQRESLRTDAKNLTDAITGRVQEEIFAIARRTLSDLATAGLEGQMVGLFVLRLRAIDSQAKDGLLESLKSTPDPAIVRTAFELPADQRAAVQTAVNETFSADVRLRFETAPNLVSGIELVSGGEKTGWNIAEYLKSLKDGIDELVAPKMTPDLSPSTRINPVPARKAS